MELEERAEAEAIQLGGGAADNVPIVPKEENPVVEEQAKPSDAAEVIDVDKDEPEGETQEQLLPNFSFGAVCVVVFLLFSFSVVLLAPKQCHFVVRSTALCKIQFCFFQAR